MEYDYRRIQNPPNYGLFTYLNERDVPLSLGHLPRTDPRACPISMNGSSYSRMRGMMQDDVPGPENPGGSRRRIAIAVSQNQL